jgi:hypothetical protein
MVPVIVGIIPVINRDAPHGVAAGILIAMLLGTVMAMIGSMAPAGPRAWPKVRSTVFFPVAVGAGMLPGVAVAGHADLTLVTRTRASCSDGWSSAEIDAQIATTAPPLPRPSWRYDRAEA